MDENNLLPGIFEYLDNKIDHTSVTAKGQDEVIHKLMARTGLDKSTCEIIFSSYFQEIRTQMLKGNQVILRGLGKFKIDTSKKGKVRLYGKFKPFKDLIEKLNARK